MTEEARERIGTKELRPVVVDRSSTRIERIWKKDPGVKKEWGFEFETITEIIAHSRETLLIYSKYITHSEVLEELRKAKDRGVRIYCLVEGMQHHHELDAIGSARSRDNIETTLVVADHRSDSPQGILYTGELTSRQGPSSPLIALDKTQSRGMGLQFMHLFWTGATKERANGKEIDPMPLKTQVPLVPPQIHGAIRSRDIKGISSLMGDSTLDEVWLSRSAPIDCFSLAIEADILIIELCDVVKKRLSWPDVKGKSIGGVESTPFLLMRSRKKCIIMNTDLGLELNKQQAEDMAKEGPKGQWTLHSGVELARLSGSVLPFDDSWDSRTEKKIETMRTVDQGSKVAKNLNDWALGIPAPEPIFDSNLVKTWKFVARLAPPTLPSDAERGRIYQMWKEFDQAFHKALADISARAEEAKEKMGKLQKLANSKKLESISEAIERASRLDMSRPTSRAEAEQRIDQIESLEGELPTLLETAAEESAEQEGQDEIQAVKKRSGKSGEPGGRMTAKELRGMMPREPLPTVGTLYENKKGQQFLAIDFTDQIEEAKNIAKLYRAALVANSR